MHSPCQTYFLSAWRVEDGLVVHPIGRPPKYGSWVRDAKILGLVEELGSGRLYLDFRTTPYITSETLGGLFSIRGRLVAQGGRVVLCGLRSEVESILDGSQSVGRRRQFFDLRSEGPPGSGPPRPDPSWLAWRDGAVVTMAQLIYKQASFYDLPILADALEDAGCEDSDVLAHCRAPGEHVRGCWVLDLLTNRK